MGGAFRENNQNENNLFIILLIIWRVFE